MQTFERASIRSPLLVSRACPSVTVSITAVHDNEVRQGEVYQGPGKENLKARSSHGYRGGDPRLIRSRQTFTVNSARHRMVK
jgi:hypothetical protein